SSLTESDRLFLLLSWIGEVPFRAVGVLVLTYGDSRTKIGLYVRPPADIPFGGPHRVSHTDSSGLDVHRPPRNLFGHMASDALHVSRTQDEEPLSASGQERPWVLRVRPVDGLPFVDDVRAHPLAAPDEQAKRVSGRIVVLRDGDDVFGRRDPRDAGEVRV